LHETLRSGVVALGRLVAAIRCASRASSVLMNVIRTPTMTVTFSQKDYRLQFTLLRPAPGSKSQKDRATRPAC
jgi:hypothetical protein